MKVLEMFWRDISTGQHLDIYITVVLAIIVAIFGIIGMVNQVIISATVLATLGLVSISMLQNRRGDEELQTILSHIQVIASANDKFLKREYPSYEEQKNALSSAEEVFFWGLTFERVLPLIKYRLVDRLKSKLKVRLLILQPESEAVRMAALRNTSQDADRINLIIQANISDLKKLAKDVAPPSCLEVRVIDYLPAWTISAFDPHLSTGEIFVSLVTFRTPNETRISFKLNPELDKDIVQCFVRQFEEIWQEAEIVV